MRARGKARFAAVSAAVIPILVAPSADAATEPSIVGDWRATFDHPKVAPLVSLLSVRAQDGAQWVGIFCTGPREPTDCIDTHGTISEKGAIAAVRPNGDPLIRGRLTSGSAFQARVSLRSPSEWFAEVYTT